MNNELKRKHMPSYKNAYEVDEDKRKRVVATMNTINHRERVIAVLNGEKPPIIPLHGECSMDVTVFRNMFPSTGDPVRDAIENARFFDNSAINVSIGLLEEDIRNDETQRIYRFETGAVWHENYKPTFCRELLSFPVKTPEQAMNFRMPDVNLPARFDEDKTRRMVDAFHQAGYFVQGCVMGAWMGIYYYLTSFENILTWMATEPEAARELFRKTSHFSIESAKRLLACGVDCIFPASDLGSGQSLLFSPAMFREYVFPWLKELADLCHEHKAYLHLHSHGHIQDIMDGIVEAGVDIINPIGPSDHNDLALFKRRWGDKITLHGGISTTIGLMSEDEIRRHVAEVIAIGRVGGRFFPRTESGIPPMSLEKALLYLKALKEECSHGYC